jgi:chaperone required for assembly of F1-ATPase
MSDDKTAALRRRFYETVKVSPNGDAFSVLLDSRPVKTPSRIDLSVRSAALADAIAAEWSAQEEHIRPHTMPFTQIACTAIDRVPRDRAAIEDTLVSYAGADLLCYRVDSPADLKARQDDVWQPVLDWMAEHAGVALNATAALIAVVQPATALDRVRQLLQDIDVHDLAVVSVLTQASGSFVLAWAVAQGHLDADAAADAAQLDERYQSELWGQDREAEIRLSALRADIRAAETYLRLHRS